MIRQLEFSWKADDRAYLSGMMFVSVLSMHQALTLCWAHRIIRPLPWLSGDQGGKES